MTIYDTREGTRLVLNQQKRGHWNRWGPVSIGAGGFVHHAADIVRVDDVQLRCKQCAKASAPQVLRGNQRSDFNPDRCCNWRSGFGADCSRNNNGPGTDSKAVSDRHEPRYHEITVREALNLMAIRSLQVANGQLRTNAPTWAKRHPISWKYRLRRDPDADTGGGGVPIIQTFQQRSFPHE